MYYNGSIYNFIDYFSDYIGICDYRPCCGRISICYSIRRCDRMCVGNYMDHETHRQEKEEIRIWVIRDPFLFREINTLLYGINNNSKFKGEIDYDGRS